LRNTPIVPVDPTAITRRIKAQASRFTFHPPRTEENSGKIRSPHILCGEKFVDEYIVPSSSKKDMLAELNRLGIHGYSLFPDFDNLALHLKTIYCSDLYCTKGWK